MSPYRWLALGVGLAILGGALILAWPRAAVRSADRPRLALLTSLPLLFDEQFAIAPPVNAAVERIERDFTLVPVPLADRASLAGFAQLLMAHPRAQPADVLVELDAWVRGGGRVVILADPALKWQSERPPGDPLRPPPDFADTGLLAHWGVRLGVDAGGEGSLRATGANCVVREQGLVAQCRVGRGSAAIIADADFVMKQSGDAPRRLALLTAQLNDDESR